MNLTNAPTSALLGLSEKEIREFSIVDAINDRVANHKSTGRYKELTDEVAKRFGFKPGGFCVPYDVITAPSNGRRDLGVTDATKGGYAVGTSQGEMIEMLRNASLARKLGVRFLSGLHDNLDLTRQTGGSTAYWLDENGAGSKSDQTYDSVRLSPKRLFAQTVFTRQLFRQTAGEIEKIVRSDIMTSLGTEQDRVIFQGNGFAGQPRGISNTPGIKTITFAGAATYAKYVNGARLSDASNVAINNPSWVISPAAKEKALTITRFGAGSSAAILSDESKIGDVPTQYTNQVPTDRAFYGANWSDAVFAEWAAMDFVVDPVTMFDTGRIKVTIEIPCDVAIRHPESFCVSTDSAAQ